MKPKSYPLAWCDARDEPYWSINIVFIALRVGWQSWQSHKPMGEIIPEIDRILAQEATA